MQFRDALNSDRALVGDGAMGSLLYDKGYPPSRPFELLNLEQPHIIEEIHKAYIAAGAQLIETNTFGANAERLAGPGQDHLVGDINAAGVALARRAVGNRDVLIAGSMGPPSKPSTHARALPAAQRSEIFREQAVALADCGADALILETFTTFEDLKVAYEAARAACDLPIIAQMAFVERTGTFQGAEPLTSLTELWRLGADVVGVNCGRGPRLLVEILEEFAARTGHPLSGFFNAGSPDLVDGRYRYFEAPPYLADMAERLATAGVQIVGGCCGTTPEIVAIMAERLREVPLKPRAAIPLPAPAEVELVGEVAPPPPGFLDRPDSEPTVVVELDPPRGMLVETVLEGARKMREIGVDLVSVAENPLASPRLGNVATALLMKEHAGVEPLVHFTCRDRNLIGLQSDIMGAAAMGLNHVLAITGDPVSFVCDFGAKGVYDVASFGLVKLMHGLNQGVNAAGASIHRPTQLRIGVAFGANVKHLHVQVKRLEKKVRLGAHFAMTQPCWDAERIREVFEKTKHLGIPIHMGVMPFASERNAEFLHNEVPGMIVPEEVRKRMKGLRGKEGRRMGCEICEEIVDVVAEHSSRIYIITPFNHYSSTAHLAEHFYERVRARRRRERAAVDGAPG